VYIILGKSAFIIYYFESLNGRWDGDIEVGSDGNTGQGVDTSDEFW
jgi:hypothetical protein